LRRDLSRYVVPMLEVHPLAGGIGRVRRDHVQHCIERRLVTSASSESLFPGA
jgi:hypothetical protein